MKRYVLLAGALLLIVAMLVGCGDSNGAASVDSGAAVGDRVTVNYVGNLDDGTVFTSSESGGPLTFVLGDGTMLAGFDGALRGMKVGDIKSVVIPAAEAYGEYRADLVLVLSRDELPEDLEVGGQVSLQNVTSGEARSFTVVDISGDEVTLDGNHALAGQGLTFMIELIALEPAGTFEDGSEE